MPVSKNAEGAAAVALGAIERKVGVAEKVVGLGAILRRYRDAHAGAQHDLMAV
jgi:hypothetical protein